VALTPSMVNIIKIDGYNSKSIILGETNISMFYNKISIINCDTNSCTPTVGIIKDFTNKYYKILDNEFSNNIVYDAIEGGCNPSNIGGLGKVIISSIETYILCISATKFISLLANKDYTEKYIMKMEKDEKSAEDSPFIINENENKVISVSSNYFAADNLFTGKNI